MIINSPYLLSGVYPKDNVLTGLYPSLYAGLDVVSRELVGMIPSVTRNTSAERAAVGQSVIYHVAPEMTTRATSPSMTIREPVDRTVGTGSMSITKSQEIDFGFVGEEQLGLNSGPGYNAIQADLFAQAVRALVNEIEVDLATEGYENASRAYGTPGTIPFATNLAEAAQVRKILDDNGAPATGRSLVGDTTIGANLRTLGQLSKANEAGSIMTLRDGTLMDVHGFMMKESAQIQSFTAGTAASATTGAAGYAVGATSIATAAAGTGNILAGDYITFAGDTNKYLVITGKTDVGTGTTVIEIAKPGLRVAIPASATAITVVEPSGGGATVRALAFSSNAIHLVARAPALPDGRDAAIDSMMITDPRSGLTFEIRVYLGERKVKFSVACAWGVKATKREHIAGLIY